MQFALGITLTACIVPIPAEVENPDAGVDNTPFVASAIPPPPGGDIELPAELSLTLEDANIPDTLYLRAFRDYNATPFLAQTTVANDPINGDIQRTTSFTTTTWCNGAEPGRREFSVVVADRPFEEQVEIKPEYQAVTAGGKSSKEFWSFRCP